MKFGLCLPNYGLATSPQAILQVAQAAEAAGYDSVWATDHLLVPRKYGQPYGNLIEALVTLGYLASVTQRVALATSVIVLPQRDPILVAKQVAAIDQLSGGRALLGVGVGWIEEEYRFLRTDFRQRGRIADEWLQVIRTLWTEEQPAFAGQWINFSETMFEPKPIQAGGVPIYIGGKSEAAIRRAVQWGDGWHPTNLEPETLAEGVAKLRQWAGERHLTVSMRGHIAMAGHSPAAEDNNVWPIVGSTAAIIERIGAYAGAGLEYLICYFKHQTAGDILGQLEQFATEVIPVFQK
ncbi:MAG: TIGR03619 family F420-dependent LLM class oxidoreductase [Anaerolineae bacterium]|nr:TIGR03619 family F420-dependent LLM class oxidoreductase [Anaerolineae bacterium]